MIWTHSWIHRRGWVQIYSCAQYTWQRLNVVVNSLNSTVVSTDCLKRVEKLKLDLDLFRDTEAWGWCYMQHREEFSLQCPWVDLPLITQEMYSFHCMLQTQATAREHFGNSANVNTQQSELLRCVFLFISCNIFLKNDFKAILTK